MSKLRNRYKGVLAKPMVVRPVITEGILTTGKPSPEEFAEWLERIERLRIAELHERVLALFDHYNVTYDDFELLALNLAQDHVPGFESRMLGERGRGRPSQFATPKAWIKRVQQFREILLKAKRFGVKQACAILSANVNSQCHGIAPNTLRGHLNDAMGAPPDSLEGGAYRLAKMNIDDGSGSWAIAKPIED